MRFKNAILICILVSLFHLFDCSKNQDQKKVTITFWHMIWHFSLNIWQW